MKFADRKNHSDVILVPEITGCINVINKNPEADIRVRKVHSCESSLLRKKTIIIHCTYFNEKTAWKIACLFKNNLSEFYFRE